MLPVTLGGVQVLVNNAPAPLIYVSAGQIIFQADSRRGVKQRFQRARQ